MGGHRGTVRQTLGAVALCLGVLAGLGAGAAHAAASGDGQASGDMNVDGRVVGVGVTDDDSTVAQSAPPMPEPATASQASPPTAGASEVVLSLSPTRGNASARTLPATGLPTSTDPTLAGVAAALVCLGCGLVRIGRQRSSSAT
jgi:hypothetical protein